MRIGERSVPFPNIELHCTRIDVFSLARVFFSDGDLNKSSTQLTGEYKVLPHVVWRRILATPCSNLACQLAYISGKFMFLNCWLSSVFPLTLCN